MFYNSKYTVLLTRIEAIKIFLEKNKKVVLSEFMLFKEQLAVYGKTFDYDKKKCKVIP